MAATAWRSELEEAHRRAMASVENSLAAASRDAAAELAEDLKQTVRRLRQAENESEALSLVVSSTAPYSNKAAAFVFEGERARLLLARGIEVEQLAIELKHAAAFFSVVETKDPVVAAATESELSAECFALAIAGYSPGERAYLFPVVVRGSVTGVLFAIGSVLSPAFELLAEAAATRIETLRAADEARRLTESARAEAARIEAATTVNGEERKAKRWEDLSPDEQAIHLRAQRFGRLKVSEMRLYRKDQVHSGAQRADIYGALRPEIDAARIAYRKEFPGMTDYLYLELLGNLANNDDRLLGPDFPGPIV